MRPGTPGFSGDRLRSAREARGLSAVALASLVGVSSAAVSQYEHGHQSPSPQILQRLADKLSLPVYHFCRKTAASKSSIVFYRSLSTATKAARTRAEQRFRWLQEIVAYLRTYIRFLPPQIPQVDVPNKFCDISNELIENVASSSRGQWMLGQFPIGNLIATMERHGVIVAKHELDSEKLDAFSAWEGTAAPYVILNNTRGSAVRHRYDCAHELGHLILHRHVSPADVTNRAMFKKMEEQAHRFAGAFLLPGNSFANDVHSVSLDSLCALKAKWRVSVGAMLMRAEHLGLVGQQQAKRLWINRNRRGWQRSEPLDDSIPHEEPAFLRKSIELIGSKRGLSIHEVAFHTGLGSHDVEELVGVTHGYFRSQQADVTSLLHEPENATISFPGTF